VLIVEAVTPEGLAAAAGIRTGDRLLAYAGQTLLSSFHLRALEENTISERPLMLEWQRDGQIGEMTLPAGELGVEARPEMPDAVLALYLQARQEQQAGRVEEAARQSEKAAHRAVASGDIAASVFLFFEAGLSHEQLRTWAQAIEMFEAGRQATASQEDPASLIPLLLRSGSCYENIPDYAKAVSCYEHALVLAEQGAYRIWKARCLHHLGLVAQSRGDPASAQDYHICALAIREALDPDSLEMAYSLNSLGVVAWKRGQLSSAEDYLRRALAIKENRSPGSLEEAKSLANLGLVAHDRGDLASAQEYSRRALAIFEKQAPESLVVANCLNSLASIAHSRGDLALAREYHSRALAIREKLAPGSLEVAHSLNNLGAVTDDLGELSLAVEYHRRALAIRENLAPESLNVASSLINLGSCAHQRGDLASAQGYYSRALAIFEKLVPGSLEAAGALSNLGLIAFACSNLSLARKNHRRALAIREKLAPDSLEYAESLKQMGKVHLKQNQPEQALPYLQHALTIVEKQRAAIQATEARALLLARHASIFPTLVQAYLALNQPSHAFSALERLRARSLSELLAERHLTLSEFSRELAQEQQELDQQQAQAYSALAQLSLSDQEQIGQLQAQLLALERRQQELTARIRAASPGYAALHYPKPLDARACQNALEAGTLLMSFLIGEEGCYLFSVTKKELSCHALPIGQKALQEKVQAFREALDVYSLENTLSDAIEQGHQLYQVLPSPAQEAIHKARRLLVCADGPLHLLPFAALVVNTGKNPLFLGQLKPLHTTFSMTVYSQTRQALKDKTQQPTRPALVAREKTRKAFDKITEKTTAAWQQGWKVLALGDPVYAPGGRMPALSGARSARKKRVDNAELAGLRSRGLSLEPLPHTRDEVQAIATLFGEQATIRTGEEATKTAAIKESEQADVIHFACHGFLDALMPLSSGLILSQPEAMGKKASEADNGLLQAWEIFKLRLHADLVVLSACQTGLGAEIRGEGLIGLTRAFTYAGAKSVLVSLWEINDASTAEFMKAFYQALREGKSKDKALQQAIKKLSRQGKWRHPFFWSGFSLVGDWQ